MRVWIDTDIGDNPDDVIALWCAARAPGVDIGGVSTVGGDARRRAGIAATLLPGVRVVADAPKPADVADVNVFVGIGPWTHVAALAEARALPTRVVLMGGALAPVMHRGLMQRVEHNVGADPAAATRVLATEANLTVVPLDATAPLVVTPENEAMLADAIPLLRDFLEGWRAAHGPVPLVLHDPAAVLIALGEPVAHVETRALTVDATGVMHGDRGRRHRVVTHVDAELLGRRVLALAAARPSG